MSDWNAKIISEFRANDGKVGGQFEGAPVALLHHVGRNSGQPYVAPVMYLADESDPNTIYVFASFAGNEKNPDWYHNLIAADAATVEVGTDTYSVDVVEVAGDARDRIYAEQARRYAGFAEYQEKIEGIRTIPVLALQRI